MTNTAVERRFGFSMALASAVLLAIAAAPWRHGEPSSARSFDAAAAELPALGGGPVIELHRGPVPMRNLFSDAAAQHPDARPWPDGMLITPPRIDPQINVAPGALDIVLSALLAPFRSLGA